MSEQILLKPNTFREKFENYWYHYKWHTIIGLFLLIMVLVGFTQCSTKENPDYKIMLCFDKYIPDGIVPEIETYFEQYAEDINGDGKVIVHVVDTSTGISGELQKSQSAKMMSELQLGEVMLFITDDVYFDRLNVEGREVFEATDYLPDKGGKAINLRDTNFSQVLNRIRPNFIAHDVYLSKRVVAGTSFDGNQKEMTAEQNSIVLMKKFIDGLNSAKTSE